MAHQRRFAVIAMLALSMVVAACGSDDDSGSDPLRQGRSIYGSTCSVCHGNAGQGGVGPALGDVVATWPSCADQVEWITLGSEGWRAAYGATYGATGRPVEGGMPAQGDRLTPEEIRLVAAFERAQYGGQDSASALADCGAG